MADPSLGPLAPLAHFGREVVGVALEAVEVDLAFVEGGGARRARSSSKGGGPPGRAPAEPRRSTRSTELSPAPEGSAGWPDQGSSPPVMADHCRRTQRRAAPPPRTPACRTRAMGCFHVITFTTYQPSWFTTKLRRAPLRARPEPRTPRPPARTRHDLRPDGRRRRRPSRTTGYSPSPQRTVTSPPASARFKGDVRRTRPPRAVPFAGRVRRAGGRARRARRRDRSRRARRGVASSRHRPANQASRRGLRSTSGEPAVELKSPRHPRQQVNTVASNSVAW